MANNGAHITNSGTINVKPSGEQFTTVGTMRARGQNSQVTNASGGVINLLSVTTPAFAGGISEAPLKWYFGANYGLWASNDGSVINESDATMNLQGGGGFMPSPHLKARRPTPGKSMSMALFPNWTAMVISSVNPTGKRPILILCPVAFLWGQPISEMAMPVG